MEGLRRKDYRLLRNRLDAVFFLFQPIGLPHGRVVGFAIDLDGVGIIDDATEDGIGEGRFSDLFMQYLSDEVRILRCGITGGQPSFSSTLKLPSMIPLAQRVGAWISLGALTEEESLQYLDWHTFQPLQVETWVSIFLHPGQKDRKRQETKKVFRFAIIGVYF